VTRGQLPQRAGLPGLNGSGAATVVDGAGWEDCGNDEEWVRVGNDDKCCGNGVGRGKKL